MDAPQPPPLPAHRAGAQQRQPARRIAGLWPKPAAGCSRRFAAALSGGGDVAAGLPQPTNPCSQFRVPDQRPWLHPASADSSWPPEGAAGQWCPEARTREHAAGPGLITGCCRHNGGAERAHIVPAGRG